MLKVPFAVSAFIAMLLWPSQVAAQVHSVERLDGTKWCTFDKDNSIARITYRGDISYFSSGNTCMSLEKIGDVGVWKIGFEWWNLEAKIRVREYALGSLLTAKVLAYQEAKSAEDRRFPYASITPGTRGAGYIHLVDSKTIRLSQLGRGPRGDVTLLVYYLEKVDAIPELTLPLTFPSP